MKRIILFGIGDVGKRIVETYWKSNKYFRIVAIADNYLKINEYAGIPVIRSEKIPSISYDEIWISTIYYRDIERQLRDKLHIKQSVIRYIEYPMPFLEPQIYEKYKEEIEGRKTCDSDELKAVVEYIAVNGVRMYCYPFYDEYAEKDYLVCFDEEHGLYYGTYLGHRIYLSKKYDTPEKAIQYLRYIHMEQDTRSPHCYFAGGFQVREGETGIDIGAAEGVFALSVIEQVEYIYLIEADVDWCEALALTFQKYQYKVTIIQGIVSEEDNVGRITLDRMFEDVQIDFVKMDIEGAELKALSGAQGVLDRYMPKLAICTYHHKEDYQNISSMLIKKGYRIQNSRGYVICQGEWELEHLQDVDFRRTLLWAEKEGVEKH